jgi:hypothetical protein
MHAVVSLRMATSYIYVWLFTKVHVPENRIYPLPGQWHAHSFTNPQPATAIRLSLF